MTVILVASLAVAAALIQVGPLSLVAADPIAAPLLPVAVIAGWGVARRAHETWLAVLLAAAVFGATSHDRVGLFVIALWPTALIALFAGRVDRDPAGDASRRLAGAALAAAGGATAYLTLLAVGGGRAAAVADQPHALAVSIAITTVAGATVAAALWRWRPRPRGLFE